MSRAATARLFVALELPSAVREGLTAWARTVAARPVGPGRKGPGLRVLEPAALHLTLCFLGARPVAEIDAIGAALGACAEEIGELYLGAPLWLPPRRPRSLAVEVHDRDGRLAELQLGASEAIGRAVDWRAEHRRFRAHITVARVPGSSARRRGEPAEQDPLPATPRMSFVPSEVVLYRSWLSPLGASYEAMAAWPLTPARP
jgi:RNA 2',3'-cyclic 3'-phosphodiesterase